MWVCDLEAGSLENLKIRLKIFVIYFRVIVITKNVNKDSKYLWIKKHFGEVHN
jgi:hypothetical protein